jgi:hypothetical protein
MMKPLRSPVLVEIAFHELGMASYGTLEESGSATEEVRVIFAAALEAFGASME